MPARDPACPWPPPGTALTAAEVLALEPRLLVVELIQAEGPLHVLLFSTDLTDARPGQWHACWYPRGDVAPTRAAFYPSLAAAARAAAATYCTIWRIRRWGGDASPRATEHHYPVSRRDAAGAVQAALAEG